MSKQRKAEPKLRVDHGPIDEEVLYSLTDAEKEWLRSWNRQSEIPDEDDDTDDGDDGDAGGDTDYDDMTNDQLKDELRKRELPVSGNHDELVARLEEDDESDD